MFRRRKKNEKINISLLVNELWWTVCCKWYEYGSNLRAFLNQIIREARAIIFSGSSGRIIIILFSLIEEL